MAGVLEQDVAAVQVDIQKFETQINNVEIKIASIERLSGDDPARAELPTLWQERAALRQKEVALRQEKAALRQKEAALRQEKVLLLSKEDAERQASGAAAGPSDLPSIEEAVMRALKRSKAEENESVSVSGFGVRHWQRMQDNSGLKLQPLDDPFTLAEAQVPAAFAWDERGEGSQSDRYMQYLMEIIALPGRSSCRRLRWLAGGNERKQLLDIYNVLGFVHIRGNTDAAIVTSASMDVGVPNSGLCILFELKKPGYMDESATYQAICQLVLANLHSPTHQPFVVLSDLNEAWRLFWLDGSTIKICPLRSRGRAVAAINVLVEAAAQRAMEPNAVAWHTAPAAMPEAVARRHPTPLKFGMDSGTDMELADLEGMLPNEELLAARAVRLLQQVKQLPAFSCLLHTREPPCGMYI